MNSAATPCPLEDVQGDGRWMSVHNHFINEAREREPDVLFLGDSLIQHLQFTKLWKEMFAPLHSLNFGIGGDQTQHVLWRLQNGELGNLLPKVIVLLVGTNNHDHTAQQVAEGIREIVTTITSKQPQANIVVMGLPPRGEKPNKLREKNATVNGLLAESYTNSENVTFLNVDPGTFVNQDGRISLSDMYDFLHFTEQGYEKLCEPLLDEIQDLMKTFMKTEGAGK